MKSPPRGLRSPKVTPASPRRLAVRGTSGTHASMRAGSSHELPAAVRGSSRRHAAASTTSELESDAATLRQPIEGGSRTASRVAAVHAEASSVKHVWKPCGVTVTRPAPHGTTSSASTDGRSLSRNAGRPFGTLNPASHSRQTAAPSRAPVKPSAKRVMAPLSTNVERVRIPASTNPGKSTLSALIYGKLAATTAAAAPQVTKRMPLSVTKRADAGLAPTTTSAVMRNAKTAAPATRATSAVAAPRTQTPGVPPRSTLATPPRSSSRSLTQLNGRPKSPSTATPTTRFVQRLVKAISN